MKLLGSKEFDIDNKQRPKEPIVADLRFKVHKFNKRKRPADLRNIRIYPAFSEFGCEILGVLYCLPRLMQTRHSGKYTIVMGWHGREYLYRHLVDEFWEIDEEYQWLREYSRAFYHESINLRRAEKQANKQGAVVPITEISNVAVYPKMDKCLVPKCDGAILALPDRQMCRKCLFSYPEIGLFDRIDHSKLEARWLSSPTSTALERAKKYLVPNAVGITARWRRTYGRNLQPIFYERLIYLLEDMGYRPIWLGEKTSIMPCPFERIINFSNSEDANDLETTLALVSQLKFTIQFWTASSRLAGLMGVPYIIFESPDQLYGIGQEGMRMNLCTKGDKKVVISHFRSIFEDNTAGLSLVKQAVKEMADGNFQDIIGLVENQDLVQLMRTGNLQRIGNNAKHK